MPTPPRNPYIAGKVLNDARGFFVMVYSASSK
jgi:hypothetical protein